MKSIHAKTSATEVLTTLTTTTLCAPHLSAVTTTTPPPKAAGAHVVQVRLPVLQAWLAKRSSRTRKGADLRLDKTLETLSRILTEATRDEAIRRRRPHSLANVFLTIPRALYETLKFYSSPKQTTNTAETRPAPSLLPSVAVFEQPPWATGQRFGRSNRSDLFCSRKVGSGFSEDYKRSFDLSSTIGTPQLPVVDQKAQSFYKLCIRGADPITFTESYGDLVQYIARGESVAKLIKADGDPAEIRKESLELIKECVKLLNTALWWNPLENLDTFAQTHQKSLKNFEEFVSPHINMVREFSQRSQAHDDLAQEISRFDSLLTWERNYPTALKEYRDARMSHIHVDCIRDAWNLANSVTDVTLVDRAVNVTEEESNIIDRTRVLNDIVVINTHGLQMEGRDIICYQALISIMTDWQNNPLYKPDEIEMAKSIFTRALSDEYSTDMDLVIFEKPNVAIALTDLVWRIHQHVLHRSRDEVDADLSTSPFYNEFMSICRRLGSGFDASLRYACLNGNQTVHEILRIEQVSSNEHNYDLEQATSALLTTALTFAHDPQGYLYQYLELMNQITFAPKDFIHQSSQFGMFCETLININEGLQHIDPDVYQREIKQMMSAARMPHECKYILIVALKSYLIDAPRLAHITETLIDSVDASIDFGHPKKFHLLLGNMVDIYVANNPSCSKIQAALKSRRILAHWLKNSVTTVMGKAADPELLVILENFDKVQSLTGLNSWRGDADAASIATPGLSEIFRVFCQDVLSLGITEGVHSEFSDLTSPEAESERLSDHITTSKFPNSDYPAEAVHHRQSASSLEIARPAELAEFSNASSTSRRGRPMTV